MIPVQGFKSNVSPDERPPFQRLNRMSLFYLLWANGVADASDSMPKDHLVKIAELNHDKLLTQGPNGTYGYKNVNAYVGMNGEVKIERPATHVDMYKPKEKKAS